MTTFLSLAQQMSVTTDGFVGSIEGFTGWFQAKQMEADHYTESNVSMDELNHELYAMHQGLNDAADESSQLYAMVNKRSKKLHLPKVDVLKLTSTGQGTHIIFKK